MSETLFAELVDEIAERAAAIVLERLRDEAKAESGELLSVADVARDCRVTKKVVYGAIGRGELQASRLGSRLRVSRSAVEAWLDAMSAAATKSSKPPRRRSRERALPEGAGLATMLDPDD